MAQVNTDFVKRLDSYEIECSKTELDALYTAVNAYLFYLPKGEKHAEISKLADTLAKALSA